MKPIETVLQWALICSLVGLASQGCASKPYAGPQERQPHQQAEVWKREQEKKVSGIRK